MNYIIISLLALFLGQTASSSLPKLHSEMGTAPLLNGISLKKVWSTHVTIDLGFCQASGTVTVTTNESTGQVHVYYNLATNCGGGISGTGGQIFRVGGEHGPLIIDPESITYEFDSEAVQTTFENNKGKTKLEAAINEALAAE